MMNNGTLCLLVSAQTETGVQCGAVGGGLFLDEFAISKGPSMVLRAVWGSLALKGCDVRYKESMFVEKALLRQEV